MSKPLCSMHISLGKRIPCTDADILSIPCKDSRLHFMFSSHHNFECFFIGKRILTQTKTKPPKWTNPPAKRKFKIQKTQINNVVAVNLFPFSVQYLFVLLSPSWTCAGLISASRRNPLVLLSRVGAVRRCKTRIDSLTQSLSSRFLWSQGLSLSLPVLKQFLSSSSSSSFYLFIFYFFSQQCTV